MSCSELKSTNGGAISLVGVLLWAGACLIWDTISNPKESGEAMNGGFKSSYNSVNL